MKKKLIILIPVLIFTVFLGGCSWPWQKKKTVENIPEITAPAVVSASSTVQMKKFADYQALKTFLETTAGDHNQTASGTAVQTNYNESMEIGTSTADIIKTDGQYIYALVYNDLFIIKASPVAQAQTIAQITFNSRPSSIQLDAGRLVVIGLDTQIKDSAAYQKFRRQSPYTFVTVFDISDPQAPKQVRNLDFEGTYQDSRLTSGRLQLVINNYQGYTAEEAVVPRLIDNGTVLSNDCGHNDHCFAPTVYYFDIPYDSYNFISLNTLDLYDQGADVSAQTYLLNQQQAVYLSAKNFYITYSQSLDEDNLRLAAMRDLIGGQLNNSDQKLVAKIDQADSDVLNTAEKEQKLLMIFKNFLQTASSEQSASLLAQLNEAVQQKYVAAAAEQEKTFVYRVSLEGTSPVYRANGSIPGSLLNPSSFFEDENGNLRLVVGSNHNFDILSGRKDPYASLYILSPDLKILGTADNLAAGENIQSVLYLGQRAYLTGASPMTSLTVVDLSNPQTPQALGKLTLPSAADYLYPYNDNSLIALGQDKQTDVYGNLKAGGLRLSLFDISDLANPRESNAYYAGATGSDSLVRHDPAAFSFNRASNLLSVPVSLTSVTDNSRPYFSGALVFKIVDGKFNLHSEIDHSDGGKYQKVDASAGFFGYDNSLRRSLFLQDNLYTFSYKYLKINSLSDGKAVKEIKLLPDTATDAAVKPITAAIDKTAVAPENSSPATAPQQTVMAGPALSPEASSSPVQNQEITSSSTSEIVP